MGSAVCGFAVFRLRRYCGQQGSGYERGTEHVSEKIQISCAESVKEIYYYSDTFRRNPKFCIACKASAETVEKIIAELKLEKDEEVRPLFLYGTPDWWSKKLEANAPSYSRRDRKKRCVYAVWHDRETERFQYAEVKY